MNAGESSHLHQLAIATAIHAAAQELELAAGLAHVTPNFTAGAVGTDPVATAEEGGSNVGKGLEAASRALSMVSTMITASATMTQTMAGYMRRQED